MKLFLHSAGSSWQVRGTAMRWACFIIVALLNGCSRTPVQEPKLQPTVLLFLGHDCPISNGYAPEIGRLYEEFTPRNVDFRIIYAEPDFTDEEASRHAKDFKFPCPTEVDTSLKLALKYGATVKPEAVVISTSGEILYRGRINDLHIDFGKKRPQATTHDLKNALEEILQGKPISVPRTKAIGCYIEFPEKTK
jgi:hypothetical protein